MDDANTIFSLAHFTQLKFSLVYIYAPINDQAKRDAMMRINIFHVGGLPPKKRSAFLSHRLIAHFPDTIDQHFIN